MNGDSESESFLAFRRGVSESERLGLYAGQLDGLYYESIGPMVFFISLGVNARDFPRNCVSTQGLIVTVEQPRVSTDRSMLSSSKARAICIPSSVPLIPERAFEHCANLSTIVFEAGSRLSSMAPSAFARCGGLASVCIPCSVASLGAGCFGCCYSLRMVIFEHGSRLSSIKAPTFSDCSSLSSIWVPSSVTELGGNCFYRCRVLSEVVFESGSELHSIEVSVFHKCGRLSSICVPSSVKKLGFKCFYL
jgi:hypothetical protein